MIPEVRGTAVHLATNGGAPERSCVAAGLVFTAPSPTLPVTGLVPEVFRRTGRPSPSRKMAPCEPPDLHSSPELNRSPWSESTFSPGFRLRCKPRGPAAPLSPLHRHPREASTPAQTASPRFGPGGTTLRSPVPPSWFRTTSTVSSASRFAGLLHPAADPGVHRVSAPGARPDGRSAVTRPRDAGFEPFEEIPADSRTASPRPLPSCRSPATTAPARGTPLPMRRPWRWEGRRRRLQGLAPSIGSGIVPHRCRRGRPTPSWASFLFKVLPGSRRSRLPPPHTAARAPEGESATASSVPHPLRDRPKPSTHRASLPRRTARTRAPRPKGRCLGPRRHTIRRPRPPQRTPPGPAEAEPRLRHGTGATRTEVRVSGPDPGRNPSEGSPRVQVHCTADRLANQPAGRSTLQANLRSRRPMPSKSVRS